MHLRLVRMALAILSLATTGCGRDQAEVTVSQDDTEKLTGRQVDGAAEQTDQTDAQQAANTCDQQLAFSENSAKGLVYHLAVTGELGNVPENIANHIMSNRDLDVNILTGPSGECLARYSIQTLYEGSAINRSGTCPVKEYPNSSPLTDGRKEAMAVCG